VKLFTNAARLNGQIRRAAALLAAAAVAAPFAGPARFVNVSDWPCSG
jgi:hypothetical protein